MFLEHHRVPPKPTNYYTEEKGECRFCGGVIKNQDTGEVNKRKKGERPFTLIDFFSDDFLLILDESHVTIPQLRAMYNGDRSRKETLVEHGFRLPSALDNRPMNFEEFVGSINQVIYVSKGI